MTDRNLRWMLLGLQVSVLGVALAVLLPTADGVVGIATVTVVVGAGITLGGFVRTLGDSRAA